MLGHLLGGGHDGSDPEKPLKKIIIIVATAVVVAVVIVVVYFIYSDDLGISYLMDSWLEG